MRTEIEIRKMMDRATKLQESLSENDINYSYIKSIYDILAWVMTEGDDPLEGYY